MFAWIFLLEKKLGLLLNCTPFIFILSRCEKITHFPTTNQLTKIPTFFTDISIRLVFLQKTLTFIYVYCMLQIIVLQCHVPSFSPHGALVYNT